MELPLENEQVFRGPGPDELWHVSSTFSTPSAPLPQVQRIKTDGTTVGPVQQLALQVYLEDGAGRLIGRGPGGYYVFAPEDGRPSLLSEGEMVSVDAQRIVDLVCDDVLTCRWRVHDRAGGEPRLLEMPPNPGELYLSGGGVASPDGRWVGFDDGEGRLQLLDLQSGAISRFGTAGGYYYGGVAWSADSSWMFWSENGSLRAWQVGVAEPVRIGGGLDALAQHAGGCPRWRGLASVVVGHAVERCPACGAGLWSDAATCPACRRSVGLDLDLAVLDHDDELGPPPRPRSSAPPVCAPSPSARRWRAPCHRGAAGRDGGELVVGADRHLHGAADHRRRRPTGGPNPGITFKQVHGRGPMLPERPAPSCTA